MSCRRHLHCRRCPAADPGDAGHAEQLDRPRSLYARGVSRAAGPNRITRADRDRAGAVPRDGLARTHEPACARPAARTPTSSRAFGQRSATPLYQRRARQHQRRRRAEICAAYTLDRWRARRCRRGVSTRPWGPDLALEPAGRWGLCCAGRVSGADDGAAGCVPPPRSCCDYDIFHGTEHGCPSRHGARQPGRRRSHHGFPRQLSRATLPGAD